MVRAAGHFCVMRGQGPRGWSRDLTDTAVRHSVRRCMCGWACHSGFRRTLGVGVGVSNSSGVGLCGCWPHADDLHNLTRGITSSQRPTGCLRTAGGKCNAKRAGGPDRDQLAGDLQHVITLHLNAPVVVRCDDCLSAL